MIRSLIYISGAAIITGAILMVKGSSTGNVSPKVKVPPPPPPVDTSYIGYVLTRNGIPVQLDDITKKNLSDYLHSSTKNPTALANLNGLGQWSPALPSSTDTGGKKKNNLLSSITHTENDIQNIQHNLKSGEDAWSNIKKIFGAEGNYSLEAEYGIKPFEG